VSYNAVHARRLKHPLFAAKWDAVSSSSRATIDMHLLEETRKTFDPAAAKLGGAKPRVTIDQAIKISQIGAAKAKNETDPFKEQAANMSAEEAEELRKRMLGKLGRLRKRKIEKDGFTLDEATGYLIPPGWVRATPPEDEGEGDQPRAGG
jgi:hypothetical protein